MNTHSIFFYSSLGNYDSKEPPRTFLGKLVWGCWSARLGTFSRIQEQSGNQKFLPAGGVETVLRIPVCSRETWSLGLLSCCSQGTPGWGVCAPPSCAAAHPSCTPYPGSQDAARKREGRQERGFPTRFGSGVRMAQSPGCSLSGCALPAPHQRPAQLGFSTLSYLAFFHLGRDSHLGTGRFSIPVPPCPLPPRQE